MSRYTYMHKFRPTRYEIIFVPYVLYIPLTANSLRQRLR